MAISLVSGVHRTDPVEDFAAPAQAGIFGMIHKATQDDGSRAIQ